MEVINENASMLSNYEVLSLLTDISKGKNGQKKPNNSQQNLATITYSALKYLEGTTCAKQSPTVLQTFMRAVQKFNLTKAERLQILNTRPVTAVEIQLIVEESEERLTEEQIEELIEIITTCIPGDDALEEPGDAEQTTEQA